MKKIVIFIAAAAMLAASCQKEAPATGNTDNAGSSTPTGKLTATFVKTKVTYTETPELNLQPSWEVGDKILGFDDSWKSYTLTVASVSAETAILSGTVPDGALHLVYKSDTPSVSDSGTKTLRFNYVNQKGDKTMPAVMLADGIVTDGSCHFTFTNAGAIISISAVKEVPEGSTISKITVEGENLSGAIVSLDGGTLKLTAKANASDAISTATLSGITVTDANGTLSSPIFIAVPAGAVIAKVSVTKEPDTMTIPSTAAEKKDIDYVEIEAKYDGVNLSTKKWAKWNVGANSQADYGWYFPWAGTEGYVWENGMWVSASGVVSYSYTLSSAKTTVASDYLYVKTQSFTTAYHSFKWAHAPFNNGSSDFDATYFSSVKSTVCPDNVLAKEYDAAHVNWGGTWRMPTLAEFQAMQGATYWAWDSTDKGYYVFAPDAGHTAGTRVSSIPGDLEKNSALLFFPAAGDGRNAFIYNASNEGFYWSSSLDSSNPSRALQFNFQSTYISTLDYNDRCYGKSVRPVSD